MVDLVQSFIAKCPEAVKSTLFSKTVTMRTNLVKGAKLFKVPMHLVSSPRAARCALIQDHFKRLFLQYFAYISLFRKSDPLPLPEQVLELIK